MVLQCGWGGRGCWRGRGCGVKVRSGWSQVTRAGTYDIMFGLPEASIRRHYHYFVIADVYCFCLSGRLSKTTEYL